MTRSYFGSIKADFGFMACNTVHYFYELFNELVEFELLNIVEYAELPKDSVVYCSPTAKSIKLYGEVNYFPDGLNSTIANLITNINNEQVISTKEFKEAVTSSSSSSSSKTPVFACTELSMLAYISGIKGYDTLENILDLCIDRV